MGKETSPKMLHRCDSSDTFVKGQMFNNGEQTGGCLEGMAVTEQQEGDPAGMEMLSPGCISVLFWM